MNGINLKDVSKIYYINGKSIRAIDNLNLDLNVDEKTVLLGESGCGKSTLLRLIAGLEEVTSGEIIKNDHSCSMVFQEPRLFPWKNVYENISFSLQDKKDDANIRNWMSKVKLTAYENAYPSQLSGGMKSRVSLARALVADYDYILMDEPFAALDDFTRTEMQQELINLYDDFNNGYLFVTHSIDEALKVGERILIMKNGKILDDFYVTEKNISEKELKEKFNELIEGDENEKI